MAGCKYVFYQLDETTSWAARTSERLDDIVGTIIKTIPKPDNNNKNDYDWIKILIYCI